MELNERIINLTQVLLSKVNLEDSTKKLLFKFISKHFEKTKINELVTRSTNIIKSTLSSSSSKMAMLNDIFTDLKTEIKNYLTSLADQLSDSDKKLLAKHAAQIILIMIIVVLDKIDSDFDTDSLIKLFENFDADVSDIQIAITVTSTCFSLLKCLRKN